MFRRRLTEIEQMQQRLLDGYLAGGVEKDVFTAKSTELKIEAERLRERVADAKAPGEDFSRAVMEAFDFAQQAAERWRVSGTDGRRAILTRALLKRSLSATSLETTKRRPFDVLIEGPSFDESRVDCTPDQTGVGDLGAGLRPALTAFAEEFSLPVLQIPFMDDLTQHCQLATIG